MSDVMAPSTPPATATPNQKLATEASRHQRGTRREPPDEAEGIAEGNVDEVGEGGDWWVWDGCCPGCGSLAGGWSIMVTSEE